MQLLPLEPFPYCLDQILFISNEYDYMKNNNYNLIIV